MARRHKCPPAGAPDWIVTYGDMMTLLLTFFILLAAMSELRREEQWQSISDSVKRTFGMDKGSAGRYLLAANPVSTPLPQPDDFDNQDTTRNRSQSTDVGVDGDQRAVTRVREGMEFVLGGRITFAPGSAELTPDARDRLKRLLNEIRGRNNKVEIRGHAATMERTIALTPDVVADPNAPDRDLYELSYDRARSVLDYLTGPEVGLPRELFRVVACADAEPLVLRRYTVADQEDNRRVELVVSEALTEELAHPELN